MNKIPISSEIFTLRIHAVSPATKTYHVDKSSGEIPDLSQQISLLSSLEPFAFCHLKNSKIKTLEIVIPREYMSLIIDNISTYQYN